MKKMLTLLLTLTCFIVNSQITKELDSVSAYNEYAATSKKCVLTKYETKKDPTFILFFGEGNIRNLEGYQRIVFVNENELRIFLDMVIRAIDKDKLIQYVMDKGTITIKGVTKQTALLRLGEYEYYFNKGDVNNVLKQLN